MKIKELHQLVELFSKKMFRKLRRRVGSTLALA
jgi:hypothetical protein